MSNRTYSFEWGAAASDDRIAIDIEAGDRWAGEYDALVDLIEDHIEPKADSETLELEPPLVTRKLKDATVYHTTRCQYFKRAHDSRTRELTDQLKDQHDLTECEYCRARRFDDVDDPRAGIEQEETAKLLRDLDADAIGGD